MASVNLHDVITLLKRHHNNGKNQIEVMDELLNICRDFGLFWIVEYVDGNTDTLSTFIDGPTPTPRFNQQLGRIILTQHKNNTSGIEYYKNASIFYEAKGIVIDTINWSVLSIPPPSFNYSPNSRIINPILAKKKHTAYMIEDGTTVTLYYWAFGNKWALSSANAYDCSNIHRTPSITFASAFYSAAVNSNPEFVKEAELVLLPNGNIDCTLAKNYCYTLLFRCKELHPFTNDPEKVIHIQTHELLPNGDYESVPNRLKTVRDQLKFTGACSKIDDILEYNSMSKLMAANFIKDPKNQLNYGIILKSSDKYINANSNICIESDFYKYIKSTCYNIPIGYRAGKNNGTEEMGIMEYTFICGILASNVNRAYLTEILLYFESSKTEYENCKRFIDEVYNESLKFIKNNSVNNINRTESDSVVIVTAATMVDSINKIVKIPPFNEHTESILRDYIYNIRAKDMFLVGYSIYQKIKKLKQKDV